MWVLSPEPAVCGVLQYCCRPTADCVTRHLFAVLVVLRRSFNLQSQTNGHEQHYFVLGTVCKWWRPFISLHLFVLNLTSVLQPNRTGVFFFTAVVSVDQAMAEQLAENYYNVWAKKKKSEHESKGKSKQQPPVRCLLSSSPLYPPSPLLFSPSPLTSFHLYIVLSSLVLLLFYSPLHIFIVLFCPLLSSHLPSPFYSILFSALIFILLSSPVLYLKLLIHICSQQGALIQDWCLFTP